MGKYVHARSSFLMGEVSPDFHGRVDLEQYNQMCETIENFVVLPSGGVRKRKGTRFLKDLTTEGFLNDDFRMIPYTRLDLVPYILLLGQSYMTFYRPSDNSFNAPVSSEQNDGTGENRTYGNAAGFDYSYGANGSATDLHTIQYAQYGKFLVLTSGNSEPLVLYYDSASSSFKYFRYTRTKIIYTTGTGTESPAALYSQSTYWFPEHTGTITLNFGAGGDAAGSRTLTSSSALFTADMADGVSGGGKHILGTYFRIRKGAVLGFCRVTGYTSSTQVTVIVILSAGLGVYNGADATTYSSLWSECQWSRRHGFPRACTFYQERLLFAGSENYPDTLWGSTAGDMFSFGPDDPTVARVQGDSKPYDATLASSKVNKINLLSPGNEIFVGSSSTELVLDEADESLALSVDNVVAKPQTSVGCAYRMPVRVNNVITIVARDGNSINEFAFDFNEQSYRDSDIRYFSKHLFPVKNDSVDDTTTLTPNLTVTPIKVMDWQPSEKILWVVSGNGKLYGCSRDRRNSLLAWHQHYIGGPAPSGFEGSTAYVRGMCVVPDPNLGVDNVYLSVFRTINGTLKLFLEVMESNGLGSIADVAGEHLDCASSATGASATSWVAIAAHLPNETVHVIQDGSYSGTFTLSAAGTLTLTTAATNVQVGYHVNSTLKMLPLQSNGLFGAGLGEIKRTEQVTVLFDRTVHADVGSSAPGRTDDLESINFRDASVQGSDPTPLFTGEKTVNIRANYDRQQKIIIKQVTPMPMTICAVIAKGVLND